MFLNFLKMLHVLSSLGPVIAAGVITLGVVAPGRARQPVDPPSILLADTAHKPVVAVRWPTGGGPRGDAAACGYTSPKIVTPLGDNVCAFVALGGLRIERGAAHPRGAVIRIGLAKSDPGRPFFDALSDGASITVTATGITMNQAVTPWPATLLMQMDYSGDQLVACGMGGAVGTLLYTRSLTDDVGGAVTSENGRLGCLDGSGPDRASCRLATAPDGSVTLEATFPYAMLRHLRDPWLRTRPGTFVEPVQVVFEFEVLPTAVAESIKDPDARPRPYQHRPPMEHPEFGPPIRP
ncbi:MAG: hypothetical protein IT437_12155 [Phycisphaerales bacterium]|nr:hypothetical protein [Phycisphaerales bacterium]